MREFKNNVEQASRLLKTHRQDACSTLLKTVAIFAIFAICTVRSFAQTAEEICSIADKEADYVLSAMERMKGKAIMFPEVVAQLGVIRYAEATGNQKMISRVVKLYKAAYLEDGCLNRLTSGYIESQATAIIPLELYRITGDKSLLKDCWRTVQGQMRNPQKNGAYSQARWYTDDMFIISMLQTVAHKVYNNEKGLGFTSQNLRLYQDKLNNEVTWLDRWKEYDSDGKWLGMRIHELVWIYARDHELRKEFDKQYLATMGIMDPHESLAIFSIIELLKQIGTQNNEGKEFLSDYKKLSIANLERLSSGKMKITNMHPFIQLYSIATGLRYGWLTDAKYKNLLSEKWSEFTTDYQTPKLWSWNVVYKPLLRTGGRLMWMTAMLEIEKKIDKSTKNTAQIATFKKVSDADIAKTLEIYKTLRNAEVTDDLKAIEKIQSDFKFDETNSLDSLIAMELYRLTGSYDYERECITILNDLLVQPLENKDLNSLLLAQGFNAYGTQKFAQSAKIKLNDSPLIKDLNIPTDPIDPIDPTDPIIRAENIYKLGMSSKDASSAIANSAKLRELCNKLQAPTGFYKHCELSKGLCFSRVSGQAIYGIVNLLKNLPKDNANYAFFVRKIKDMAYALERNQSQNGLWHTLPEDFNSSQDSLGSAFFVATLAIALEQKWIHRLEFRDILDLGWKGVQTKIKGNKLTDAVVACEPRKISSAYALLSCNADDELTKQAIKIATSATKSYYASKVPNSEEDFMAVLSPMSDLTAHLYEGKLPDGRILKHISTRTSFDITKVVDIRGKKKEKIMKKNPDIYLDKDFRLTNYEILDKEKIIALPDAIKKLKYPVAGITVWLKDNPSVHTVSDELGYCFLSMPFVPLKPDGSSSDILAQIPGFKPCKVSIYRNYIAKMIKEGVDNTEYSKTIEGPSDKISGKLLAPFVLKHHRQERKELLSMLGKQVKEIPIENGVIMRPVYLKGKLVSVEDGKPVDEASIWLKRNPFMVHHACEDGEFEILGKDVALYDQTKDTLLVAAPHYKPIEISLESYMNDKLTIKMQPRNYNPIISTDTTIPMIKIPSGLFRMGQGLWELNYLNKLTARDFETRNCWPIQTVTMPSFYFSQYNMNMVFRNEIYDWAEDNGYDFIRIKGFDSTGVAYPIVANALSEKDGFTPCYYTSDLRVIRKKEDISENYVCNWRADGYRLPTWAEWVYATRAGRTSGPFFGDDADKYRDYYISARTSAIFEGSNAHPGKASFARRLPLNWGIYGATLGQMRKESVWDFSHWNTDNSWHPRGPTLRDTRNRMRYQIGHRGPVCHITLMLVDNLETQWHDEWLGNLIGFQFSGFGNHISNGTFGYGGAMTSIGDSEIKRFARTTENICNDIRLVKTIEDSNITNPPPVETATIGTNLEMMPIPAGSYSMGSYLAPNILMNSFNAKGGELKLASTNPEHFVELSAFSISRFETTVQQWSEVQKWGKENGYTDLSKGNLGESSSKDLRHPVNGISWFDTIKWCNAASEKAGLKPCYTVNGNVIKTGTIEKPVCDWNSNGYRLPTEAEWEYAEQAGSDGYFYWGNSRGLKYHWTGGKKFDNNENVTHPVGQKYGNNFGLYDTIGNVWEWCWDWKAPHKINLKRIKDSNFQVQRKNYEVSINPKGPISKQVLMDYIDKMDKVKGKEAIAKEKKEMGPLKQYLRGDRILKGGGYNHTTLNRLGFSNAQYRSGLPPEESSLSVGFRVARGK